MSSGNCESELMSCSHIWPAWKGLVGVHVCFRRASTFCQLERKTVMPACNAVAGCQCTTGTEVVLWVKLEGLLLSLHSHCVWVVCEKTKTALFYFVCPFAPWICCSEFGRILF